ncbi:hypothetical protein EVAR_49050_1 [Eumeta japonica]|uniref:Uncharacterized protein n=1 Tax=Eumeta variegata TaxID=151549 RepID=A0A4C1Y3B8_EUMVA|nr:hypothetical protein EVAR_49050_1 [Eumeta japonica]
MFESKEWIGYELFYMSPTMLPSYVFTYPTAEGTLPQCFDVTTSNNSILRAAWTKKLTSLSRYARCPVPQARLEWSAQFVSCCIYLPSTRSA